jgi:hypothetical protein
MPSCDLLPITARPLLWPPLPPLLLLLLLLLLALALWKRSSASVLLPLPIKLPCPLVFLPLAGLPAVLPSLSLLKSTANDCSVGRLPPAVRTLAALLLCAS